VAKTANSAANGAQGRGGSVAGYFRKEFKRTPKLLQERSNEELFRRWLRDHPGHDEVPRNVRIGLQNVKNDLRGKLAQQQEQGPAEGPAQPARRAPARGLEQLEEHIDECLALAKGIDRETLHEVIELLRRARNAVVRKAGGG
jgi:hypothetical protein